LKTAIAILNWNGRKLLEEFLPSVVEFSKEAEIYVIDNASNDDSVEFIKLNFPDVKIIQNEENFGYAKGYNEGINKILRQAQDDNQQIQDDENIKSHAELVEAQNKEPQIFCLLNSDVKVSENWLKPIENLFNSDSKISVVQPKILDYKNPGYFEYAGAGGGFIDNFGYPFCRGRVFWTLEKDEGQYDDTVQTFWASGACFFIRKNDFLETGGFDEGFFAHMEEIDLCWRLNNSGKKVYYCGESKVYHLGGGTLKNSNPKKTYLNFRNSLWMLVKNLPERKAFPFIFTRLSLDGITGIVFLFYEGFSHFWAVLDSHFGFYKKLFYYLKLRKPGTKNYFEKRNVPFQYFVQKRKYYKDLK
jgi:GT2 family glycosyltransferase